MASSVLFRGRMKINRSSPFLACLQALRDVCELGTGMCVPETTMPTSFPNLMGQDDDDQQPEASHQYRPGTRARAPAKTRGKAQQSVGALTLTQAAEGAVTPHTVATANASASAAAAKVTDSPQTQVVIRRAPASSAKRGRPATLTMPQTIEDWERLSEEERVFWQAKIDEIQMNSAISLGSLSARRTENGQSPRQQIRQAAQEMVEVSRDLFAEEAEQDVPTQPQPTPVTQDESQDNWMVEAVAPSQRVQAIIAKHRRGGAPTMEDLDELDENEEAYYSSGQWMWQM
eukprot:GILJ01019895.1.p2 GENE.GILJ01019895.1~~GILJ01019895.1.p2  ORF type:complete len:288 (-),score=60.10 GILJ01019895.1:750-1613(-)